MSISGPTRVVKIDDTIEDSESTWSSLKISTYLGSTGPQGERGYTGDRGATGPRGYTGAAGIGFTGDTWTSSTSGHTLKDVSGYTLLTTNDPTVYAHEPAIWNSLCVRSGTGYTGAGCSVIARQDGRACLNLTSDSTSFGALWTYVQEGVAPDDTGAPSLKLALRSQAGEWYDENVMKVSYDYVSGHGTKVAIGDAGIGLRTDTINGESVGSIIAPNGTLDWIHLLRNNSDEMISVHHQDSSTYVQVTSMPIGSGDAVYNSNGLLLRDSSSQRYKDDITPLTPAQASDICTTIDFLDVSTWKWKDIPEVAVDLRGKPDMGVIAEPTNLLDPTLTYPDDKGNPRSINQKRLIFYLVTCLQETRRELKEQKAVIDRLIDAISAVKQV
jgi:hypothetical protein